jgi:hypothetical protein
MSQNSVNDPEIFALQILGHNPDFLSQNLHINSVLK